MKSILYISDLNKSSPIFHSQVVPHIQELRKHFHVTLLILDRNAGAITNCDPVYYYNSVKGDYFYYLAKINFLIQKGRLHSVIKSAKFDLIYSRGIRGGLAGTFIKTHFYANQIALLNDTRGDSIDEAKDSVVDKTIVTHTNRWIYKNMDLLFLVSGFLKDKICRDYSFNLNNAYVFPTFVPDDKFNFRCENRKSIRQELGFSNTDIVILYSGNLAKWQNVDTILNAFKMSSNPALKMLVLTKDNAIKPLVKELHIPEDKIRIQSVSYANIETYYHAADYGILIRDNTDTNKSAAPTKFSEYVNSGLAVIINSIDADYVRIFKEKKLEGILLPQKTDLISCFNALALSKMKRNTTSVNLLSDLVLQQAAILNNYIHS